jgi:hypothetical protein
MTRTIDVSQLDRSKYVTYEEACKTLVPELDRPEYILTGFRDAFRECEGGLIVQSCMQLGNSIEVCLASQCEVIPVSMISVVFPRDRVYARVKGSLDETRDRYQRQDYDKRYATSIETSIKDLSKAEQRLSSKRE